MNILRRTGRSESLGQGRWIRNSVVIAEVALSFVLLVGSGLMVRSFVAIYQASPGFNAENLVTFQLTNQGQVATTPVARLGLMRDVRSRLEALPGVTAVAATSFMPLANGQEPLTRYGREEALADPTKYQQANFALIQPGYFAAMETPLIDGRAFTDADNVQNATNIVVDRVLAAKMFPGQRAVGQRILVRTISNEPDPFEIIGVVEHQRAISPAVDGREALYLPDAFLGSGNTAQWAVRSTGETAEIAASVRRAVADVDGRLGVFTVESMDQLVDQASAGTRFVLWLLSLFAGVAMVLAAVGLYSVLSTAVRQRTAEIGVRMAFGASTRSIFMLIVSSGLTLSAVGVALGTLGALVFTNAISGQLVGISATDPLTYAAIAAGFLVVACVACVVPALRASRLNPLEALRQE
ncbi:MAG: ABC transporter permease [Acidobacteria bacterium]|nr:ABC transporter permease [Acidobacteriota bacterium]